MKNKTMLIRAVTALLVTALLAVTAACGGGAGGGALVWVGLAALIAAQLWDAVRVRRCSAVQHPTPKGAL